MDRTFDAMTGRYKEDRSPLGRYKEDRSPLGKYWDAPMTEEIRRAFWDVANIYDRTNLHNMVKHHLAEAQRSIHQAWQLQTHMNELGEFEKEESNG